MYAEIPEITNSSFYGMITNIDENLKILENKLTEWGLKNNTIFIFTTDNGTSAGVWLDKKGYVRKGFNAGMRGMKVSKYEGGHRVPFFVRWPENDLVGGIDINSISSYTDVFPTLADFCNLVLPENLEFDGMSLKDYFKGSAPKDRVVITDTQRMKELKKWKDCSIMTNKWRLIDGKELYDMETDPGQRTDIAESHPEVVEKLKHEYEVWWEKVSKNGQDPSEIIVDFSKEYPVVLSSHDLISDGFITWNQNQLRNLTEADGHWALNFAEEKEYEIQLFRWPPEANLSLNAEAPAGDIDEAGQLYPAGKAFDVQKAWINIPGAGGKRESVNLAPNAPYFYFKIKIPAGSHKLETGLIDSEGNERSAYYVRIL
jgi:hypothetical protein